MVTSENDGHRTRAGQVANFPVDHRVAPFHPHRFDVGVTGVNHVEHLEEVHAELEGVEPAVVVVARPDGAGPESRPRPVGSAVVERSADDDRVRGESGDLGRCP